MLAIVPARGGSVGLPGKNIKLLDGKPLIAYTILAALNCKEISRVVVSTDNKEIANVAMKYGAEVPFMRPDFLSTNEARSIDVIKYTIERLEREENAIYNEFTLLQPTSPFRTSLDISNSIALFKTKNADSVISCCQEHHPIKWHKYLDKFGRFEDIFDIELGNRQDQRVSYYPNGAIYIFKKELIETENYYSSKSFAYVMDRNNSVDIDTIDDFEYAEWLFYKNKRKIQ